jgi:hypothetical protein
MSGLPRLRASAGRVLYQVALSLTGNDNGFVTMVFLLIQP